MPVRVWGFKSPLPHRDAGIEPAFFISLDQIRRRCHAPPWNRRAMRPARIA
jgi:hypothetical protein